MSPCDLARVLLRLSPIGEGKLGRPWPSNFDPLSQPYSSCCCSSGAAWWLSGARTRAAWKQRHGAEFGGSGCSEAAPHSGLAAAATAAAPGKGGRWTRLEEAGGSRSPPGALAGVARGARAAALFPGTARARGALPSAARASGAWPPGIQCPSREVMGSSRSRSCTPGRGGNGLLFLPRLTY